MADQDFCHENSKLVGPRCEMRIPDCNNLDIVWDYHPMKPKWSFLFERQSDGVMKRVIWDPTKKPLEPQRIMVKQDDGTWKNEFNPRYVSNFPYVPYEIRPENQHGFS